MPYRSPERRIVEAVPRAIWSLLRIPVYAMWIPVSLLLEATMRAHGRKGMWNAKAAPGTVTFWIPHPLPSFIMEGFERKPDEQLKPAKRHYIAPDGKCWCCNNPAQHTFFGQDASYLLCRSCWIEYNDF